MSTDRWELTLPWKTMPLSLNRKLHWAREAPIKRRIRADVKRLAEWKRVPPMDRAEIILHWQATTYRDRDTDNPTPSLKSAIDGLVDAGVLAKGDSSAHVTSRVVIHDVDRGCTLRIWIEIRRVA